MYFDVFLNGSKIGTFGHEHVENLSISVSGNAEGSYLFAGAVCSESGRRYHYTWAEVDLKDSDIVTVSRSEENLPSEPVKKYDMDRSNRKTAPRNDCDFCHRTNNEVDRIITGHPDRPSICSECVELCVEILQDDA